jgi:hypothetical protein
LKAIAPQLFHSQRRSHPSYSIKEGNRTSTHTSTSAIAPQLFHRKKAIAQLPIHPTSDRTPVTPFKISDRTPVIPFKISDRTLVIPFKEGDRAFLFLNLSN